MKEIRLVVFNLVVFLMAQFGAILVAFLTGLASSDKYILEQWIVYYFFCVLHIIFNYFLICSNESRLRRIVVSAIICSLWIAVGWFIAYD